MTKAMSMRPLPARFRRSPSPPRSPRRLRRRRSRAAAAAAAGRRAQVPSQLPRNVRPLHYSIAVDARRRQPALHRRGADRHRGARGDRHDHAQRRRARLRSRRARSAGGAAGARPDLDRRRRADRDLPLRRRRSRPAATGSTIDYSGKINTQAAGLFALDYDDRRGARSARSSPSSRRPTRAASSPAGTSPISARPTISRVTVPAGQQAVSNMPEAGARDAVPTAAAIVTFQTTPAMSCYLLFLAVGEFDRITTTRRRRRDRRRHPPRRRRAGPLGARELGPDPALVQRLFRHALSAAQARQCRRPGQQPVLRRDGELGRDLLLRDRSCSSIPRSPPRRRRQCDLRGRRARNRPPMVRRSRHHGLVGRSLAERRLRLVDGDQGDRRAPPGMGAPARPDRRPRSGDAARFAAHHPPGRPAHHARSSRSARRSTRSPTTRARR